LSASKLHDALAGLASSAEDVPANTSNDSAMVLIVMLQR
jgi:hypothetical protein